MVYYVPDSMLGTEHTASVPVHTELMVWWTMRQGKADHIKGGKKPG